MAEAAISQQANAAHHLCALAQILPQCLDHEERPNGIDVKVYFQALSVQVAKFVVVLVTRHKDEEVDLQM